MSHSLSSLLNGPQDAESNSPPPTRGDSLPPAQSSPNQNDPVSDSRRSSQQQTQHQHVFPKSTNQEAAQALASLSQSPAPPPTQWHGYNADQSAGDAQQSGDRRPSGYGDPMQLLPPSTNGAPARRMSSPTLDQNRVASRSPEQQRVSIVSPEGQSDLTLPPLPGLATPADHMSGSGPSHAESRPVDEDRGSSPAIIKEEAALTPQPCSPVDARRPEMEQHTSKAVSSLKNEHGLRTQSPLRESSVPVPTTEIASAELPPAASKKRPAPKNKKGTATTMKKAPPSKRRKVEVKRSVTPSSRPSKVSGGVKSNSHKCTPANSSPAPSAQSNSEEQYDDDDDEDGDERDTDLYCICRKTDNGSFMIGCDGTCDDWYHGKCVGIADRDKTLIEKYICPICTQAGIGRTAWKRMCRRGGCRKAALVGKTKLGGHGSKYCSEECGLLYFRDMVARTRGNEEGSSSRSARKKGSVDNGEDDLGSRGGPLAAGEVKALLDVSTTADEFRKLGDGVLSPPATPNGNDQTEKSSAFTETEETALQRIQADKEEARRRHVLLKDRMRFVTLVKQNASRLAMAKEVKPKDFCGYDSRLEWTEEMFRKWRTSATGQAVFEQDTLAVDVKTENGDAVMEDQILAAEICDRKKCARHFEWAKLAIDDLRFGMNDNGDRMRALDREEKEIRERATLRGKAGASLSGEGSVEMHEVGLIAPGTGSADKVAVGAEVGQAASPLSPTPPTTNGVTDLLPTDAVESIGEDVV
ncbi:Zinc finger PHD-type protein [Zymoseptoria brevis]|uniref:Zinc finger PHD-type protein n=1 Tax=Zymoseptoria brevis TaxID=1047168 RepID=A0A0F4GAV9_9PEZI|nr:Zinc finger PHD-type protein [Zymoseptoria brevis]